MKWLNYHHLLYFREIAKEGSISKASEKLLVGQPALSTQLKQLEESLGVLLFERKSRGLALTDAGKTALEYAEDIFRRGEEFLRAFETGSDAGAGRYRLGAIAGLPKSLVTGAVTSVKRLCPDCFVSIFEAENEALNKALLRHELDLALTNDSGKPSEEVFRQSAGKVQIKIYGAPKFAGLRKNFPASLQGAPFVLHTMHSKLRYDIEQSFLRRDVKYKLAAECQDSAVKKELSAQGEGLVFLPEFAAKPLLEENKLTEIGLFEELFEEYWLLSAKSFLKNPVTDALIKKFRV